MSRPRRPGCRWGGARGFSLAELAIVVAIIAIVGALAVPRFGNSLARLRADSAARRIKVDLELARQQAKTSSSSQTVVFDVTTDSYGLPGMPHPNWVGQEYEVRLSEEPYLATIVSADFGGDLNLVFNGWGMPDSGGSVVIEIGEYVRTIWVNPDTGRASVQ